MYWLLLMLDSRATARCIHLSRSFSAKTASIMSSIKSTSAHLRLVSCRTASGFNLCFLPLWRCAQNWSPQQAKLLISVRRHEEWVCRRGASVPGEQLHSAATHRRPCPPSCLPWQALVPRILGSQQTHLPPKVGKGAASPDRIILVQLVRGLLHLREAPEGVCSLGESFRVDATLRGDRWSALPRFMSPNALMTSMDVVMRERKGAMLVGEQCHPTKKRAKSLATLQTSAGLSSAP